MKRHVKASSAGSNSGQGNSLPATGGAFAIRGVSGDADGSGAPAARGRFALLALAIAAFVLLALAPFAQAKAVVNGFGSSGTFGNAGTLGGQFVTFNEGAVGARGIAVNNSGAGGVAPGTIYAVDGTANRIQRFSPSGAFERTWGQNVTGRDEKQQLALVNIQGTGTFTLTYGSETTSSLSISKVSGDFTAPKGEQIQAALSALPSIGAGNVAVNPIGAGGGPYTIRFVGALSGTNVPHLVANSSVLPPADPTAPTPPSVSITTTENGSGGNFTGFEICTVAASCQEGHGASTILSGGGSPATISNGGDLDDPRGIAVNQSTGHVYVTEAGNRRVQEFDADGNFIRAWGGDVQGVNEIQTLVVNATAGQYKLTFGANSPSANINFNVSAAALTTALSAAPVGIGTGNLTITGGTNVSGVRTYVITFTGAQSGTDVPQLVSSPGTSPLSGGAASATVTTNQTGSGGNFTGPEVCTVAAACKPGVAGPQAGQFGAAMGTPAVDSSGNVWVPDPSNGRIQVFDSSGNFLKMAGGDVVTDGAEGTGNLSNGSTVVSAVTTTKHFFEVGQTVTAPAGIQAGSTIISCAPNCLTATTITLSKAANATVAGQTLTVAPGAGNVPTNEVQTITATSAEAGSRFRLSFNGQGTGAKGVVTFTEALNTATVSSTTEGAFAVGQVIAGAGGEALTVPTGTTITAVSGNTLTLSNLANTGFAGTTTAYDIPFNASAATIQAKLEGVSTIGAGNVAVTGPDGGPWAVEFKGSRFADTDVPAMLAGGSSGSLALTSANAFEICSVAADCRAGASGVTLGQFSSAGPSSQLIGGPGELAFDSTGNLYAIDPGGKRVQKFNPALSSVSNFGAAALTPFTGAAAPEHLAASQSGTRLDFSVINTAAANERQIVELDTTGALKDTSLAGAGLTDISGLAANNATGALYATTTSASSPFRVLTLNIAPPDPAIALNTITTKTDSTATLTGTVDPKGGLVSCQFQYSTNQSNWTDVAIPGCDSLNPSGGVQAISATATGLIPSTHYFVRLSVSRPLVGNSTKTTSVKAFDTDGIAPVVTNAGAMGISDTSARIAATIDPRNSQASWVVQYGTTPSLGSATVPASAGSGTTPVVVSQVISGLKPNTTYYFRVVASNLSGGDSNSPTKSFTTRSEALPLPDDRGYEMVSPVEKSGGGALSGGFIPVSLAPDGEAVQFQTTSLFGNPPGVQTFGSAPYVSWRTAESWQTKAITPPICRIALEDPTGTNVGQTLMMSRDLDQVMFTQPESDSCAIAPLDPAASRPSSNLYLSSLFPGASSYELLAPAVAFKPGTGSGSESGTPVGYNADFTHLVYSSTGNQTPDSPAPGSFDKLYEWDHGTLRLVSRDPAGTPFLTSSGAPLKQNITTYQPGAANTVSADGSRIFFQNPTIDTVSSCANSACELYMRQDGTTTIDVSASECTSSCGSSQADEFAWATADGEKAFFTSAAKLTDDNPSAAGKNLYLYTHGPNPASEPHNLILLSKDEEPADQLNADVKAVLGVSEDGDTVFFAANGQLVSGSPTGAGPKLYRWRWNGGSPTVDYLATLESGDNSNWFEPLGGLNPDNRVTPDGQYLLIRTALRLDPAADSDADADLYRWSSGGGWRCVSCQAPGTPSAGPADGPHVNPNDAPRTTISDDGSRVFFLTPEVMVPQDVNGTVKDVYEWHDGTISMISSGTSAHDVKLLGPSPSGDDVFFYTEERLVGWDSDEIGDIYDARVGGGFPEPPAELPSCEGEACRDAATNAPASTGAGTAVFEGSGNKPEPASCPKGTRKVTVDGKSVCKKKKKARKHHKKKQRGHPNQAGADRGAGK